MKTEAGSICVVGLGYVGLVQAVCLAHDGHDVIGVDHDAAKLDAIVRGVCPFTEPNLDEWLSNAIQSGRLKLSHSLADAVQDSDISLICVGTPSRPGGEADLDALWICLDEIRDALSASPKKHAVVIRSTIPPGTMRHHVAPRFSRNPAGDRTTSLFVPEFMREGHAIQDYQSPPQVVAGHGADEAHAREIIERLFAGIRAPRHYVDFTTAELIKYTSNSWHALKVCFANEIGTLSAAFGIDSQVLMAIFAGDRSLNISSAYLRPGMPFGGACLPKDVAALNHVADRLGLDLPLLSSVIPSNQRHLERCARDALDDGANLIGMYGIAFKSGTNDLRNSPSLALIERLLAAGKKLCLYDEHVAPEELADLLARWSGQLETAFSQGWLKASGLDALQECDLLLMCTAPRSPYPGRAGQRMLQLYMGARPSPHDMPVPGAPK